MPVSAAEKNDSPSFSDGDSPRPRRLYTISGTTDYATAVSQMLSVSPATFPTSLGDLARRTWGVDPNGASDLWDGFVEYGQPGDISPVTGDAVFSFDTGGGTQHITQSRESRGVYPAVIAPSNGAINVNFGPNPTVEGTDIIVPVYKFSEVHYLDDAVVTAAYRGVVFNLTGQVNNASFKGCAAGECLFMGASGSKRGRGDWEITFNFAASPNKTDWTPFTGFTGVSKKGWEYMWVRYVDDKDAASHMYVKKPFGIYIERVYDEGDFSQLGIGT